MAFKLSKAELEQRSKLIERLNEAHGKLEAAINGYNEQVAELREPVEQAVSTYNEELAEAAAFAAQIAESRQGEYDDKSDKWQEGDKASAAADWISEWENFEADEIEIEWPDELELPDTGHSENLEGIAEEMSE
jgi:hypothetical protein